MLRELASMPPVDELIAGYFQAQGWWTPPASDEPSTPVPDEEWKPDMPEFPE